MKKSTANKTDKRYRAYSVYRDSGVEWLGQVPEHWDVLRLKYAADLINQKVDGKESGLPYTGLEHIESWTGKRIGNEDATNDGQASVYKCGDVLFGKLRPYLAKVYASHETGICTGELLVLRPKRVIQVFLNDFLLNPDFISHVDSSTYGAKMPRASWDFIGNTPTLVPPVSEQTAIASFLDRETARIDALIEKKQRQIELLQEKRAALISHAVTKGLHPDVPMKDSGIEWLGQVPEGWEVKKVKYTAQLLNGYAFDSSTYVEDGIPIIRIGDVSNSIDWNNVKRVPAELLLPLERFRVNQGDILLAMTGATIGKTSVYHYSETALLNQRVGIIRATRISQKYLSYFVQSNYYKARIDDLCYGGAQENIGREDLAKVFIAVPSHREQNDIVAFLDMQTEQMDRLAGKVRQSIEMLREYRTALISAAVTGKIDVRESS